MITKWMGAMLLIGLLLIVYGQYQKNHLLTQQLMVSRQKLKISQVKQQKIASLDQSYMEQLVYAKQQMAQLRNDLLHGHRRLYLKSDNLSQHASTSCLGHAAAIELSETAGSTVLDLRASIISDQTKINYLQQYIRLLRQH